MPITVGVLAMAALVQGGCSQEYFRGRQRAAVEKELQDCQATKEDLLNREENALNDGDMIILGEIRRMINEVERTEAEIQEKLKALE